MAIKETTHVRGVVVTYNAVGVAVFEDKRGAQALAENPLSPIVSIHKCTIIFLRELVADGDITVNYISGKDQFVDLLTKALDRTRFKTHRDFLLDLIDEVKMRLIWNEVIPLSLQYCSKKVQVFVLRIRLPLFVE